MTVRIVAQGTVAAADVPKFRKFVTEVTAAVRAKERGRTLSYDFYTAGSGELQCLIHESYADANALITHLQNLGAQLAAVAGFLEVERMIISGNVPAPLVEQFKALGNTQFYGETVSIL